MDETTHEEVTLYQVVVQIEAMKQTTMYKAMDLMPRLHECPQNAKLGMQDKLLLCFWNITSSIHYYWIAQGRRNWDLTSNLLCWGGWNWKLNCLRSISGCTISTSVSFTIEPSDMKIDSDQCPPRSKRKSPFTPLIELLSYFKISTSEVSFPQIPHYWWFHVKASAYW